MTNDPEGAKTAISLPKGGGAVKGIGETFQPNLFSGTGNFSVPIFTSPGRGGFGPQLSLQYSTGSGNGPFGLGWQLSIPRITRKTEKGLPTYTDEDVFVMSGAEDLVPHLQRVATDPDRWEPVVSVQGEFTISLYRPRTEWQFARIERWTSTDGDVHWRATTKENVTSIYGRTQAARITDPERPRDVFEWLLEETFDARGHHIAYGYVQEPPALRQPGIHEHNRSYTQVYIRRILYGNTPENLDPAQRVGPTRVATDHRIPLRTRERHYLFEVLFDYDDLAPQLTIPHPIPSDSDETIPGHWPVRKDPFSSFRAGFEIRTLRRCRRVLMLHHFREGELADAPLVKSTDFEYETNPDTQLSCLTAVTVSGYRKDPGNPQTYLRREMPPVAFKYSAFEPQNQRYQSLNVDSRDFPPRSLNAPDFTVLDIFGNGLPDILQDTGGGFHYWENLGQGRLNLRRPQPGDQPSVSFTQPQVSIGDMGGDGLVDLVVDAPPFSGFYESTPDGRWKAFRRFDTVPSFDLRDPNTRLVDLTGDGLSDVLVTRDDHFLWLRCRGEAGYDEPRRIPRKHDLKLFPDVYFDDPAGRVRLADMSGDGLNDIVLVHDGRIDYWPNLGYGRFGRRITMAKTPRIGFGFDPSRLFLVDLDGTGCADIVYVDHCQVYFSFNQSGNAWSDWNVIKGTPPVTDLTAVQFIDFYGTGTATLLWSYDFGQQPGGANYKILDFCGGQKPNLLVEMDNNIGATTRVQYAPSTKFYLEDKANRTPWMTNLPFPVQVLEKTEVIDHISRTKLVTTYKYHHGYYDGREREFRGFGRVDQFDTEFFDDFSAASLHGDNAVFNNKQAGFHLPPIETRSWFHTGIYFDADRFVDHHELTEQYRREYYSGDPDAFQLGEHVFRQADGSEGLGKTPHETFRALRGAVLRTEVYGRDGSAQGDHPYVVTENRFRITALQPGNGNSHGVYLSTPQESLSYQYERNPADPRIGHSITLGIDDFGNVTDSVAIAYPRRVIPADLPEQGETRIVYTRADFINRYRPPTATAPALYYAGVPCQARAYEITGIAWKPGTPPLDERIFETILDQSIDVDSASFKPYHWQRGPTDTGVHRRIIEWTRAYFRTDADPGRIDPVGTLSHRLPLGEIESLALPYESYQAAFTDALLQQNYDDRIAGIDLAGEGGFHPHSNHPTAEGNGALADYWWIPSGRQGFDPDKFFQADRSQDPFGNVAAAESDAYALLMETARDALPAPRTNVISARNDYRVLQPFEVTDPNGNRSQVAFDTLGLVAGTAVMGKELQDLGDSLVGFQTDLSQEEIDAFFADPDGAAAATLLAGASSRIVYDETRFQRLGLPPFAATLAREIHVSDLADDQQSPIQMSFGYSDGFGREIQRKIQAEPGPLVEGGPVVSPRWVGSGWAIFNNKGKPVRQYEPFFSASHDFEFGVQVGVSPVLFYDPLGRAVATLHPNHTYEKVVFDPWRQVTYDVNDTVAARNTQTGDPRTDADIKGFTVGYFANLPGGPSGWQTWRAQRLNGELGAREQVAAAKAAVHADTPTTAYFDTLGRPFLTVAHNRFDRDNIVVDEQYATRVELDIEGNQRAVIDARDRLVMRYDYDMLGHRLRQASMEAGERWMLSDVAGDPIRAWDSRGFTRRMTYDALRRPLDMFVSDGASERLAERTEYGEAQGDAFNHRGRVFQVFDGAGVVTSLDYDFKGNLLASTRQLLQDYKNPVDWAQPPALETEVFSSETRFDALNRPIEVKAPDGSRIRPSYNEANLLEQVEAHLRGASDATVFVSNIDYNAKGQRTLIEYGNGARTAYAYDEATFRLIRLTTTRPANPDAIASQLFQNATLVQDLRYTYDPVGNIARIEDAALKTVFHDGQQVDPVCRYTYDALYRLIEAQGRENIGQSAFALDPPNGSLRDYPFAGLNANPNDIQALRNYTESYEYDPVGNFEKWIHQAANGSWTQDYAYEETSQLESGKVSNRLSRTTIGQTIETYSTGGDGYDAHGSMLHMPHLPLMQWDDKDQLQATSKQVINNGGTPETTYYVYDAAGQRVRKVTERQAASGQTPTRMKERIYLGGFELYREFGAGGAAVVLERETLHVMDGQQRVAIVETKTIDDQAPVPNAPPLIGYQFGNHLGSASLELDDAGAVISYEEYFPYGSTSYQAGRSAAEVGLKRYRYTGKERDEETGFAYHGARYYTTWLGVWVNCDPLGLIDGVNRYHYARRNPISVIDPNGTQGYNEGQGGASSCDGSAGAEGAGVGVDPRTQEREASAKREAEARSELSHVRDRFEEAIGGPLYKKIEVSNGHVYVIGEEELIALGVSAEQVRELDQIFRAYGMVPPGEGVLLRVGQVEPGLPWHVHIGTQAEYDSSVAEARERLREERFETAKDALITLFSMGRLPRKPRAQAAKKAPSARFPSSKVTAKANTDIPTLRVTREDGSRVYVQLSTGVTVRYDAQGNPDFSPYLYKRGTNTVEIDFTGNRRTDERAANLKAQYKTTPENYTWHHAPGQRMQLVRSDVHDAFRHVGEFARHKASQ